MEIDHKRWPVMVEHCTFEYMKKHADQLTPLLGKIFDGGGSRFINKGSNARWAEVLSTADSAKHDEFAGRELSPACASWLATGALTS